MTLTKPISIRYTEIRLANPQTPGPKDEWGARPWTIYFVYTRHGNFVVKGYSDQVSDYVKLNFPNSFYRYTYWKDGQSRGSWSTTIKDCYIYGPSEGPYAHKKKYSMTFFKNGKSKIIYFRRIPHQWIEAIDSLMAWQINQ
jgi:hypothetical protein